MQARRSIRNVLLVAIGLSASACGSESTGEGTEPFTQDDASISETSCDGKAVGTIEKRVRFQMPSVKSDAQCLMQDQTRTCGNDGSWSTWSGDYTAESCKVEGMASCDGMPHGTTQTRTRYEAMSVAASATCSKQDQTRACEDGTWSAWSGTFTFETCNVQGTLNCGTSPDGATEKRTAYEAKEVGFDKKCSPEEQTRTCKMGTWSAWSGAFKETSCTVKDAKSCGNTPHKGEETQTRWKASLVEANEKCEDEKQTRVCTDGTWGAWSGTFTALTCDVKGKRRCGDTPHGGTEKRTLFEKASVAYDQKCVSVEQTRECTDGTFGNFTPTTAFAATTCKVAEPRACGAIAHNGATTRNVFKDASPAFAVGCESQVQTGKCTDGTAVYDAPPAAYPALTCTPKAPQSCEGGIGHEKTTTRTRFENASVEFGTTCKSELQTGTCFDGKLTWTGSYAAAACVVAPPASCEGTASGTKETRKRFEKLSVPAGSTCRPQDQTRTCTNGKWSAWTGTYTELTCKVRGRDCSRGVGGGADILDGASDTRTRYEAAFPAATCKAEAQTRLCTNGTFATWNGTFKAVGCSPLPATSTGVVSCRTPSATDPQCREWRGASLAGYKSQCATGDWDTTRGCPTAGTVIGKCSGTVSLGSPDTTTNFFYEEGTETRRNTECTLQLRTWTAL